MYRSAQYASLLPITFFSLEIDIGEIDFWNQHKISHIPDFSQKCNRVFKKKDRGLALR